MSRVMDGRAVSRGLCFTHGNPTLQPSYFTMVNTASPAHASLRT
jgi:pyruvate-formate lyase-activating enzyme